MINGYLKFFKTDENVIETPRLLLRRMRVSDRDDMYDYAKREEVTRYLLWKSHKTRDHTSRYLNYVVSLYKTGEFFDFAIEYKENRKMIGTCGLASVDPKNDSVEIGYVLSPDYWGKGIATEALGAILRFAFCDMRVNRAEARYMAENEPSRRVMEKCNMTFEGVQRQKIFVKEKYRDVGVCSILAEDYFKNNEDKSALSPKKARGLALFFR